MPSDTPQAFEPRFCAEVPTSCCDYAVISHITGKEVCRVWDRDDVEKIARLLNDDLTPTASEATAIGAGEVLRESAARHAPVCTELANATPISGEPDPLWWQRQSALREAGVILRLIAVSLVAPGAPGAREAAVDRMIRALPAHASRNFGCDPIQESEREWMRTLYDASLAAAYPKVASDTASGVVTQADREVAWPFAGCAGTAADIEAGKSDWLPIVQAFARHRLAASPKVASDTAPGVREAFALIRKIAEADPRGSIIYPDEVAGEWEAEAKRILAALAASPTASDTDTAIPGGDHALRLVPQSIADGWQAQCSCGWSSFESFWRQPDKDLLLGALKSRHAAHIASPKGRRGVLTETA